VRVEEGYRSCPYHSRTHAADVLRTAHVIATRGGLVAPPHSHAHAHHAASGSGVVQPAGAGAAGARRSSLEGDLELTRRAGAPAGQEAASVSGSHRGRGAGAPAPGASGHVGQRAGHGFVTRTQDAIALLTFYMTAVVGPRS
jgi:hypothetical protein